MTRCFGFKLSLPCYVRLLLVQIQFPLLNNSNNNNNSSYYNNGNNKNDHYMLIFNMFVLRRSDEYKGDKNAA